MCLGLNLSSISGKSIDRKIKSLAYDWLDYSKRISLGATDMLCIMPNAFIRTTDTLCILCDSSDFIKDNVSWFTLRNRSDDMIFVRDGQDFVRY